MDENLYTSNSQGSGNFNQPAPTLESTSGGAPGQGAYQSEYQTQRRPHSKLGIASFVIGVLLWVVLIALLMIVGVLEGSNPEAISGESPVAIMLGLSFCSAFFAMIIALVLGIIGVFMPGRRKVFGIIGICLNGIVIFGVLGLMVIGIVVGQSV